VGMSLIVRRRGRGIEYGWVSWKGGVMWLMIDLDFDVYVLLLSLELLSVLVYSWIGSLNLGYLDRINLFAVVMFLCYDTR